MYYKPMDFNKYIIQQKIPMITSSDKNSPVGLFSPDIFGVTEDQRTTNFAFINLNAYVMFGGPLDVMRRVDSKIFNCCTTSTTLYIIDNGELRLATADDIDTEETPMGYGPEYLYQNWDKIDKRKYLKTSGKYANNELKAVLSKYTREQIFTHYQYVEAIAYRDEQGDSSILTNDTNILLADLIRYSNIISNNNLAEHRTDIVIKIQQKVLEIFDLISSRDIGPHGNFRTNILSKAVDDSSRMTILPVVYKSRKLGKSRLGVEGEGIPIQHLVANFRDFVVKYSKDFIENLYDNGYFGNLDHTRLDAFYDKEFLEDAIAKMDDPYFRISNFDKIQSDGTVGVMEIELDYADNEDDEFKHIKKPLSWIEFFYIVLERYIDVYNSKALWTTRYPVDSMLSSQPFKPVTLTLAAKYLKHVNFMGFHYDEYPFVNDWIKENYQDKIFENGCRVSSASAVGFNGKKLPMYIVICA